MNTALRKDLHTDYHSPFPRHGREMEKFAPLIQPSYSPRGIANTEFDPYVVFIDQILRNFLPQPLIAALSGQKNPKAIKRNFLDLLPELPLLTWNHPDKAPCTLCISLLCHSDFTQGVGRYVCDILARWLIPGKFLNISSVHSLNFRFIAYPVQDFFFHQVLVDVDHDQDLEIIKNNWESLERETRLSILSVRHARHVISAKNLSSQQKQALIRENLTSILDRSSKNLANNVFDQMHHFLFQLNAEAKIKQIQDQFSSYIELKPKIFDRDIFTEIKHFIFLLGDSFTGLRNLRHVARLISYQYLFRKTLKNVITTSPEERFLSLKVLKTQLPLVPDGIESKTVLGILCAINVLGDSELIEEKPILEAISHCLPHVLPVENSFILDRRSGDPIRIFYLEIEKKTGSSFSFQEKTELQKSLPGELKKHIESMLHPASVVRNDEEIRRDLVLQETLSELKNLVDPQVREDSLLENFFHSITPSVSEVAISPSSLKTLFQLMQDGLKTDPKKEPFSLKGQFAADELLIMTVSTHAEIKEKLDAFLLEFKIPSTELSYAHLHVEGMTCLGYFYHSKDPSRRHFFYSTLFHYLQEWASQI